MPLSADGGGTTASGGNAADGGHDRCTDAPLGMRPDSVKVEAALTIAFSMRLADGSPWCTFPFALLQINV